MKISQSNIKDRNSSEQIQFTHCRSRLYTFHDIKIRNKLLPPAI
jgi:hypothetical protein